MKNRQWTVILSLVLVFCIYRSNAQELTAETVLQKCVEALGGRADWQAIESMEISGNHSSFSRTHPFSIRRLRPDLYRIDYNVGDRGLIVAYDGHTAWWQTVITIVSNADWPVETPASHTRVIRADAEFEPPLISYQERGHRVEFRGEVELEGQPFYLFDVTLRDGFVEHWYLDMDSFLPAARIFTGAYHAVEFEQRIFFSDYREVAGVLLPHMVESEVGNDFESFEVQEVRVNGDIDAELFTFPLPAGMNALQSLAGQWDVEVEFRGMFGMPWGNHTTVSLIEKRNRGSLLEERIAFIHQGVLRNATRLYTYDRFRKQFRVSYFDDFTSHLDILEGTASDDGSIIVSNLPTGTSWTLYGKTVHTRETLFDIHENSFKIVRETSDDGGKTWVASHRFTYTRAPERPR